MGESGTVVQNGKSSLAVRGADGEVVGPEQVVQLVEAGDEDGDEGAVRRRGVTVERTVEWLETRVMGEQHFLSGDESRVEDGERGEP